MTTWVTISPQERIEFVSPGSTVPLPQNGIELDSLLGSSQFTKSTHEISILQLTDGSSEFFQGGLVHGPAC